MDCTCGSGTTLIAAIQQKCSFIGFELDEHYPISIEDCEDEDGNRRKGIVFGSILMTDLLSEWQRRKKDLADGKISKAEYTEWKLNWPKTTDDCGKHEPAKEWRNL